MREKVKQYIMKNQMLASGDVVAVGVSGGADSVCLLFILASLAREMEFSLICVHVNHGIRETAERDAIYVEKLCKQLSVPFVKREIKAEEIARLNKESVEEAGRNARYAIFEEVLETELSAIESDITHGKIAVAHNQNDQAETVLFHLFRGSNIKGLGGMRPIRGNVIRPLLSVKREEIEAYLNGLQIEWQEDETNTALKYTRNKIRHRVLPIVCEELSVQAVDKLSDMADEMRETERFLSELTQNAYRECVTVSEQALIIAEEPFLRLDYVLKRRLLFYCLAEAAGSAKDLTNVQITALVSLFDLQVGKQISLPYQLKAERLYEGIVIKNDFRSKIVCNEMKSTDVTIPGQITDVFERIWTFELIEWQKNQEIPQKKYTKLIDYDKITKCLKLRTRQSGDVIAVGDYGEQKKLKDYFINEKIPKDVRDAMPLLADDNHIVWVPGARLSAAYKISSQTNRVLRIHIGGAEEDG